LFWLVLCLLIIVLIGGCSPRYSVAPAPPRLRATVQELIVRLDARTESLQTLKALVTIRAERQPAVTASLVFSRSRDGGPPSLRLKGFDAFGRTLFDLVSIGDRVLLTIPGEGRVLEIGPDTQEDPSLPVQAAELRLAVSALVGPFVEPGEIPVVEHAGANYLIHLVRVLGAQGHLTKRLWIERGRLQLVREEIFEDSGILESLKITKDIEPGVTIVEFFDYQTRSGPAGSEIEWPNRMILTRPGNQSSRGSRLELEFNEVHPNAVIPAEEFRIP
jgi:hypothetical protein